MPGAPNANGHCLAAMPVPFQAPYAVVTFSLPNAPGLSAASGFDAPGVLPLEVIARAGGCGMTHRQVGEAHDILHAPYLDAMPARQAERWLAAGARLIPTAHTGVWPHFSGNKRFKVALYDLGHTQTRK